MAYDLTDASIIRRCVSLHDLEGSLISFTFRRGKFNPEYSPNWHNVDLGHTTDGKILNRLIAVGRAYMIFRKWKAVFRGANIIMARNLDVALLGLLAKRTSRSKAVFVYEVLDVHGALTRPTVRSRFLRWVERRVLNRSHVLVVSSEGFVRNYFSSIQGYTGPSLLLENKLPQIDGLPTRRRLTIETDDRSPVWTIGWFGTLRCKRSLEILVQVAEALPNQVRIVLRGRPYRFSQSFLDKAIRNLPNVTYGGPYLYPDELEEVHRGIHFNWCADFADAGANSDWLLPNRLYEGGYFGVPSITIAGHESDRVAKVRGLGVSVGEPVAEGLIKLLSRMTVDEYRRIRDRVENAPLEFFLDLNDHQRVISQICAQAEVTPDRRRRHQPEKERTHIA